MNSDYRQGGHFPKVEHLNETDLYLFNTGNAQKAYMTFGCHYIKENDTHRFCVWAPMAQRVSLVGDFNGWNVDETPMQETTGGTWYTFVKGIKNGDLYKFAVWGADGVLRYKSDPFAFYAEVRPDTASKVWELGGYGWHDRPYMDKRDRRAVQKGPISIYEIHLGSWRLPDDGGMPNYREIARQLVPYLTKMGFTHVELMPITEYPFDMSWGYQVTGYYGVTSRYGTPQDFMYLVDKLHEAGIGVILDWVPAHFPKDSHGLAMFDGTHQYDHMDPRQGEQPDWGTNLFNYARPEVTSFLISSAVFFADVYHIDGIRIDAVSAMLYLDFGKQEGQYVKNKEGGNINLDAVEFLKKLNTSLLTAYKGFMSIAEESTAYPYVTRPPYEGGLGFTFKWNMGFMHDTLYYMSLDHLFRKDHHEAMTFSMQYAFSENYVLPYSHDEVVHGKASMINKMFGSYEEKFSSLRALYGFVFAHPGKKLLFMGDEFAQFIEWDYQKQLDWFLTKDYPIHAKMSDYVAKLNKLYRSYRALNEVDDGWDGFEWLNVDDSVNSTFAFERRALPWRGKVQRIICVSNFTPVARSGYRVKMTGPGILKELLSSDDERYGGSGIRNREAIAVKSERHGSSSKTKGTEYYAEVAVPPLSTLYFELTNDKSNKKQGDGRK